MLGESGAGAEFRHPVGAGPWLRDNGLRRPSQVAAPEPGCPGRGRIGRAPPLMESMGTLQQRLGTGKSRACNSAMPSSPSARPGQPASAPIRRQQRGTRSTPPAALDCAERPAGDCNFPVSVLAGANRPGRRSRQTDRHHWSPIESHRFAPTTPTARLPRPHPVSWISGHDAMTKPYPATKAAAEVIPRSAFSAWRRRGRQDFPLSQSRKRQARPSCRAHVARGNPGCRLVLAHHIPA